MPRNYKETETRERWERQLWNYISFIDRRHFDTSNNDVKGGG